MDLKATIAAELEAARRRTLDLLAPVPEEDQVRQHSPLMSPLVWDLAHIGYFEELWLLQRLGGTPPIDPRFADIYDAFRHPRTERRALPLLRPADARSYLAEVRARVLAVLERIELDSGDPLLANGFVYGMVIQHEHQHDETMLATLQLRDGHYPSPDSSAPRPAATTAGEVRVDGGPFVLGTDEPWAYDNERPPHEVELDAFSIDATPVTNRAYLEFVEAGGYDEPRVWSEAGWPWRREAGAEHPQFWQRDGDGAWSRVRFGRREALPPDEAVEHVSWHEADAYARWAGKRLPTEAEWEKAAKSGSLARTGEVWEWTASDFLPYPGFSPFPYREYSEVFFGPDYKVLRGGSWATHPLVARASFRNWDYPIRRQIFAGFRSAGDG